MENTVLWCGRIDKANSVLIDKQASLIILMEHTCFSRWSVSS